MLLTRRNNDSNWLSNFFDDNFFDVDWAPRLSTTAPAVNVKEDEKQYTMEIAVPGLKKEYVRVGISNDGNLNVAIENKMEHKDEEKGEEHKEHYLRREFSYSNYEQSYVLPDDVNKEQISAKVENGILYIYLPKFIKSEDKDSVKNIEIK